MREYLKTALRYFILVVLGLLGLNLFYFVFAPLTIYPTYSFLSIFYNVILNGNLLSVNGLFIEIVGACIAGSAYYFLLILNLSVPGVEVEKRIKMILFGFLVFFLFNLARIIILSIMYVERIPSFDFTHQLFWYLGSTILVLLIWFAEVKIFKIKAIPIYTDLKNLYNQSNLRRR